MFDIEGWEITETQEREAREVIKRAKHTDFFKVRQRRNIRHKGLDRTPEEYWRVLVGCIVTTQQRSGPGTIVGEFVDKEPFPLRLSAFPETDPISFARETLTQHGLPGRRKGRYIGANYQWFQQGGLNYLEQTGETLEELPSELGEGRIFKELRAALGIQPFLLGIGPKQSRNFWQWLGLSQWEIPIDSRVLGWLSSMPDIPPEIQVSQGELSDEEAYRYVMSWIQALSVEAETLPCLLDAAVFIDQQN